MQTILHNCCGLDVHKDSIVACILKTRNYSESNDKKEKVDKLTRTFTTFPDGLNALKEWLESEDCHHVAMESTGIYWMPIYEVLEGAFDGDIEILLVNARHMRNVPGKKTDIKDSEWIAKLLRAGLLRGSFIPPAEVRELRQLTRYRKNIVGDVTKQKNRIEKTLQMAGFKLSTFLSDIFGVSGRNLMNVLIKKGHLIAKDVETEAKHIAAEKRSDIIRSNNGQLSIHQRHFLKLQIEQLDTLVSHLKSIEESIDTFSIRFQESIDNLDTIPGIAKTAATAIVAEVGVDMSKFPTAEHFCSWAGLSPSNNESAGKKKVHESALETPILKD
jgi:VCBS repeat-containing protein